MIREALALLAGKYANELDALEKEKDMNRPMPRLEETPAQCPTNGKRQSDKKPDKDKHRPSDKKPRPNKKKK